MAEATPAGLVDKLRLIEFILVDNWAEICHGVRFKDLLDINKLARTKAVEFKDKMRDPRFTEEERAIVSNENLYAIRTLASKSSKDRQSADEKGAKKLSEEKRELEQQKEVIEQEKFAVTEELVYDDVEITPRGSRASSPTPSGNSVASASLKTKDKKQQKLDKDKAKKRDKSVKHFKQFGLKTSDPSIQELVATVSSEKSKDKDMLQIAIGEKVQLVMRDHPKMKPDMWLVEKSDGTMGLARANIFAEGEAELYETC
ncbi:hypothetical protein LOD99_6564 [Oopsacas minuta]|uniref:Uncharacterized protein n=1 Tax=Oopsacas minuta TaxID=111878 RepID=A0AAV7JN10_9METZ|nr:hypothetical protein LOD99_6564 [Oopsacas minuta]